MNLLLMDLHQAGGHHMAHLRAICQQAQRRSWNTHFALTAQAQQHSSFATLAPFIKDSCRISTIPSMQYSLKLRKLRWVGQQLEAYLAIRKGFQKALEADSPDAIYIIDCDSWYPCTALFGSPFQGVKFVTMTFSVRHHRIGEDRRGVGLSSTSARIQRMTFEKFLNFSDLACVLTPDDTLSNHYAHQMPSRVRFIPDIADLPPLKDKQISRSVLGIDSDRRVILSFGSISFRKGIRELIDFLNHKSCPSDITGLIAGEADAESTLFLKSELVQDLTKRKKLVWLRGFLDDKSTSLAFSSADIAWIFYHNFYNSSGFLWQAALAGLPVIGSQEGLIGEVIKKNSIGITMSSADAPQILDALTNIYRSYSTMAAKARQEGAKHSASSFGNIICNALQ